jgi:hypothetical protein
MVEHCRKFRDKKQGTFMGKYCFINMTIENWSQLPAKEFGAYPLKPKNFRFLGVQTRF